MKLLILIVGGVIVWTVLGSIVHAFQHSGDSLDQQTVNQDCSYADTVYSNYSAGNQSFEDYMKAQNDCENDKQRTGLSPN